MNGTDAIYECKYADWLSFSEGKASHVVSSECTEHGEQFIPCTNSTATSKCLSEWVSYEISSKDPQRFCVALALLHPHTVPPCSGLSERHTKNTTQEANSTTHITL
jgi:hypothetical protein